MRMSNALIPTLRDNPADADTVSAQLLLRAGFIRKSAAGLYHYLPLGKRVLSKIETIVREEMDAFGGQELLMPIVQSADLWLQTGRWHAYGPEMFKVTDRHDRQFCLGPTHEELITDLVHSEVTSYRQLPLRLYQIQNKYRDEKRPRFGLIRSREFIMKDAYSFHETQSDLEQYYNRCLDAYNRIFARCGLKNVVSVLSSTGDMGGSVAHEFQLINDMGEDTIYLCDCGFSANKELINDDADVCPKCGAKLGIKLSKFGPFIGCEKYPTCKYTKQLNKNDKVVIDTESAVQTKSGNIDLGDGIEFKIGKFGPYVTDGVKNVSAKQYTADTITLEIARELLSNIVKKAEPVKIGENPETKKMIFFYPTGRYGAYISSNRVNVSVREQPDLETAIKLKNNKVKKK